MRRLLAVVGAVAMIGAAVLVRDGVLDGGGSGGGGGSGAGGDGPTRLICATELADACQALADEDGDVTFDVQPAGDTAELLTEAAFDPADADFDAWLTLQPWPALVELRRELAQRGPALGETSDVLATTGVAIVTPSDRAAALTDACTDEVTWRCLGEINGRSWADLGGDAADGRVEAGHDDPTESATGLAVLAHATGSYFGDTEYVRNDFDDDRGFRPWLARLEGTDPNLPLTFQDLPVLDQVVRFPRSWDAVGALGVTAEAQAGRAASSLDVLYPAPMVVAEVVMAPVRGHVVGVGDDALTAALEAVGWDPGPASDGAVPGPNAGVHQALIEEWEQVTR